jgi:hypothetical protein
MMRGLLAIYFLVLVAISCAFGTGDCHAMDIYRYRVDTNDGKMEFIFRAEDNQQNLRDDNLSVREAMMAPDAKSLQEIARLADNWAAQYYQIPAIVGSGLLTGSFIIPKSGITCLSKPIVHWLIDYPNAKGDGQTYFAVVLPDGTIVPPQVVQIK